MKVGIKGQNQFGSTAWIHFERVPGARVPQVRITTTSEQIYISEENFLAMADQLFGTGSNYAPRHGGKE